jgi:hypothetical protein
MLWQWTPTLLARRAVGRAAVPARSWPGGAWRRRLFEQVDDCGEVVAGGFGMDGAQAQDRPGVHSVVVIRA